MPATPAIDVPSGWMAPKGHAMAHSLHPMHSCSLTWMRSHRARWHSPGRPRRRGHPRNGGRQGGRNTAGLHERQARRILKTLHPVGRRHRRLACSAADAPLRVDVDEAVHPPLPFKITGRAPERTAPGPKSQRERDYTIWFTCVSSSNLAAPGSTSWGAAASTRACLSSVY